MSGKSCTQTDTDRHARPTEQTTYFKDLLLHPRGGREVGKERQEEREDADRL